MRSRPGQSLTLRPNTCFSAARPCPGPSLSGRLWLSGPALEQRFILPYHSCQAGNVFDRILDFLFGHLDQCAVLVLRWQRLRAMPRDPGVQLQRRTGGVRGCCHWLSGTLPVSRAREGTREGRGSGLRSGIQEGRQGRQRVGVSQVEGNMRQMENRRKPRGQNVRRTGFSISPRVLAEEPEICHLPCMLVRGAPITPLQLSLMPGKLSSEQAASLPFYRKGN